MTKLGPRSRVLGVTWLVGPVTKSPENPGRGSELEQYETETVGSMTQTDRLCPMYISKSRA